VEAKVPVGRVWRALTEPSLIRIWMNTEAEVDYVADRVVETVERLRELSPLYEMAKEGVDLKSVKWAAEAH